MEFLIQHSQLLSITHRLKDLLSSGSLPCHPEKVQCDDEDYPGKQTSKQPITEKAWKQPRAGDVSSNGKKKQPKHRARASWRVRHHHSLLYPGTPVAEQLVAAATVPPMIGNKLLLPLVLVSSVTNTRLFSSRGVGGNSRASTVSMKNCSRSRI